MWLDRVFQLSIPVNSTGELVQMYCNSLLHTALCVPVIQEYHSFMCLPFPIQFLCSRWKSELQCKLTPIDMNVVCNPCAVGSVG